MVYGERASVITHLKNTDDFKTIQNIIKWTGNPTPGSNVNDVLLALQNMFSTKNGARPNMPKVAIIFADDEVLLELPRYKQSFTSLIDSGVKVVFVHSGKEYVKQLLPEIIRKKLTLVPVDEEKGLDNKDTVGKIIQQLKSGQ